MVHDNYFGSVLRLAARYNFDGLSFATTSVNSDVVLVSCNPSRTYRKEQGCKLCCGCYFAALDIILNVRLQNGLFAGRSKIQARSSNRSRLERGNGRADGAKRNEGVHKPIYLTSEKQSVHCFKNLESFHANKQRMASIYYDLPTAMHRSSKT